jgi:hypothetical protein
LGFVPQPNLRDRRSHWINANDLTSPLLADLETKKVDSNTITTNTTIGHDSFIEDNILTSADNELSSSAQVGITEVDIFETSLTESSVLKNGSGKIDPIKANLPKNSVGKVNPFHETILETTFVHTNSTEIGKTQISVPKMPSIEIDPTKVGFGVNTSSEAFVSKISSRKTLPSKILLPSSVEPEQFFSIHDSTSEIIDEINNSSTNSDSFGGQIIKPEAIYEIKSTNAPLTNIPYSRWVSSLNLTYAIGDRTQTRNIARHQFPNNKSSQRTTSRSHHHWLRRFW